MQILFLVSAHNSLSQRAWIALTELGHHVAVAFVDSASAMETAVRAHAPDLIVCPFLKTMIPESIWRRHRCLIVHPGPRGDRGPSSLDWAIEFDKPDWGVTVLQADGEFDAGEVWATSTFNGAEGGEEQPLSARGPSRGNRGSHRRDGPSGVDGDIGVGDRRRGERGAWPVPTTDDPGGPRYRLEV